MDTTIVKFAKKGKVKRANTVEVQKLQDYGALAIDAKAALIQELSFLCHFLCSLTFTN
jgi:hypothetical protein